MTAKNNNRKKQRRSGVRRSPEKMTGTIRQGRYVETIPFSLEVGHVLNLQKSTLTGLPAAHPFRVKSLQVHADQPYVPAPANDASPGYFFPGGVQVELTNSEDGNSIVATSGVHLVPSGGRKITVKQPRESDWVTASSASTYVYGVLSAPCVGPPGNAIAGYLRGILYVEVEFGTELSSTACPSSLLISQ